jgi:hypothetical protein
VERIDPSDLLAALNRGSRIEAACIREIEKGAQVLASPRHLSVTPGHLLPIYRSRLGHLAWIEAETLGGPEFLRRLERVPETTPLSLALVRGDEFTFAIFTDEGKSVVACLGVARGLENPDFDWESGTV